MPATAPQLQAIHSFTEELTSITGGISLYNEALGTTSDVYQYEGTKTFTADVKFTYDKDSKPILQDAPAKAAKAAKPAPAAAKKKGK